MLNISKNYEFVSNMVEKPVDSGLGITALEVYTSWAINESVSPTDTTPDKGIISGGGVLSQIDLGFEPFLGISQKITITTRGTILFYDSGVPYLTSTQKYGEIDIDGLSVHNSFPFGDTIDPIELPMSALLLRNTSGATPMTGIDSGSRFQMYDGGAIMFINFKVAAVTLKFNSYNQSVDIYIENKQTSLYLNMVTIDVNSYDSNGDVNCDSNINGMFNDNKINIGNLTHYTMSVLPLATISGNVRETDGVPIIRQVSAINQDTKELKDTTMSDINGDFQLKVDPLVDYIVICEDTNISGKNALVYDRINVPL